MARVSREQFAENRQRILDAAARLFREKGFDGIGLDGIMQEAGLTHGGFYGHFASKTDLAEKALAAAQDTSIGHWRKLVEKTPCAGLAAILHMYLSPRHRDQAGAGCPLAALGSDVARQPEPLRRTMTEAVEAQRDILAALIAAPGAAERREQANATLAGIVGALVLSRAVTGPLSDEILVDAAKVFGRAGKQSAGL
jgi:TetR/AcrR family transcriptional repressor of nem operon